MTTITLSEAIEFVWREAEMLDAHDYDPWLALWLDEGRYVIPIARDTDDFEAMLNVAYDDADMRAARVKRLKSGFSMSAAPPARTVRTVSRFVPTEVSGGIKLRAAQHIVEYKYERTRLLAADVTYRLGREAGSIRLGEKIVRLINSDDALHGIGYLF